MGLFVLLLRFLVLFSLCSGLAQGKEVEQIQKKDTPNILFILTDDQAPWAIGSSGNEQAITPNMDRLAEEGVSLPNSYTTTPVCSPSRAGLMTSRYGFEIGLNDWINQKAKSLTGNDPENGLDPKYETWPELLQETGYYTGLIGKWHIGYLDEHHPTNHGYDEFTGFKTGLATGAGPENPVLEKQGNLKKYNGLTVDILTQEALEFIDRNQDRKFALSLHYRAPHAWWLPVAPSDEAPYLDKDMVLPHPNYPDLNTERAKKLMREYLSSVRGIDRNLGLILDRLDDLELGSDTLIVFTSDHGYNMGHNGIWHKGNGYWLTNEKQESTKNVPGSQRPNMYDNSLKVPAVVRWPGVIKAGSVNLTTMSNLDWFPTIARIAKAQVDEQTIVRGKDCTPALLDAKTVLSSDSYAVYSTLHQTVTHMRSYSDGEYKLVRDFLNEGCDEFYDLRNDSEETKNLIDNPEFREVIDSLHQTMIERTEETNDPVGQFF